MFARIRIVEPDSQPADPVGVRVRRTAIVRTGFNGGTGTRTPVPGVKGPCTWLLYDAAIAPAGIEPAFPA